jgi:hypothetical protein
MADRVALQNSFRIIIPQNRCPSAGAYSVVFGLPTRFLAHYAIPDYPVTNGPVLQRSGDHQRKQS